MSLIQDNPRAGGQPDVPRVTVCVCTYLRPVSLSSLLTHLKRLQTDGLFNYSVMVVDDDPDGSAKDVVLRASSESPVDIRYALSGQKSIAKARNLAIRCAEGDLVAFIDDDEFPEYDWLLRLFCVLKTESCSGVLGPVVPWFPAGAPQWVRDCGLHDRPRMKSGTPLAWEQTRTGNVLLQRSALPSARAPFDPECVEGSDQEFFRTLISGGHSFVWCDEAIVYEMVPPTRWTRSFLLRRALSRGVYSIRNLGYPLTAGAKSAVAVPLFAALLPAGVILGQGWSMRYLFKLTYHVGRLSALARISPPLRTYISD